MHARHTISWSDSSMIRSRDAWPDRCCANKHYAISRNVPTIQVGGIIGNHRLSKYPLCRL